MKANGRRKIVTKLGKVDSQNKRWLLTVSKHVRRDADTSDSRVLGTILLHPKGRNSCAQRTSHAYYCQQRRSTHPILIHLTPPSFTNGAAISSPQAPLPSGRPADQRQTSEETPSEVAAVSDRALAPRPSAADRSRTHGVRSVPPEPPARDRRETGARPARDRRETDARPTRDRREINARPMRDQRETSTASRGGHRQSRRLGSV